MDETIISHLRHIENGNWQIQSNENHSEGVAKLANSFASEFDFGQFGEVLGLLHDKGKEQPDFQKYIKKESGYEPDSIGAGRVPHAFVGALLAKQLYPVFWQLLCNPILGHHAGLYDYDELEAKLMAQIPEGISKVENVTSLKLPLNFKAEEYEAHHLVRLLFSCLVDADYLDTERFMNITNYNLRGHNNSLQQLLPLLNRYLSDLKQQTSNSSVNIIRNVVQNECLKVSGGTPGFYSLTVPTGGGKTLSSLVWAINHAIKYGKKRIIIAIPYTSIIIQTADTLRKIFGKENVLEHHSNTNNENNRDSKWALEMRLATENWDYPIIVTTNVQLFESIYSNKTSACRKLHNICNSVIILDEVQTLPIDFLQPIVDALKTFQHLFGASVLFTTASQPVLTGNHRGTNPIVELKGIDNVREIIPESLKLYDKLRRVTVHFDKDGSTYDDIANRLSQHSKVLCVVNTRKDAQEVFSRLPDEGCNLHLSRMMCPEHIRQTIKKIKNTLSNEVESSIRVVSTQLIEAGVDIDFPIVFRQETGLDSILQAAGRCNREGKSQLGDAFVFSLSKEHALPPGHISFANQARLNMNKETYCDPFAPQSMNKYFENLYSFAHTFDKTDVQHSLCRPFDFQFETAAQSFKLIESNGISVIVNWEHSLSYIERLKKCGPSYGLMKSLAQYSVDVKERDFNNLKKDGIIEELIEGIYWIPDSKQYDEIIGLSTNNHWLDEILTV